MSLLEQLNAQIKEAMKAANAERLNTLRFLTAQIHNREIEKRSKGGDGTLTDEETQDVLRKEVKKRREAADLYRQGGRADMAEKEEKELSIIQEFLPATPTEADIRKTVAELKAQGISEFPQLMKESMARLKGADGSAVAKIIKEG